MNQNRTRVNVSRGSFMRRIVITGPQPVDMLDLVGPLEVFKFAPEYEVAVASPEGTTELQLNHGFKISYAVFCLKKKKTTDVEQQACEQDADTKLPSVMT